MNAHAYVVWKLNLKNKLPKTYVHVHTYEYFTLNSLKFFFFCFLSILRFENKMYPYKVVGLLV